MVIVNKEHIEQIPILHVVRKENFSNNVPLVFFIHGVESIKERNLQYAYMLADKGFRVVLPDALYHGDRSEEKNIYTNFWKIILTTIHELKIMKDHFVMSNMAEENRIGLAGTSMGAIITLGAMAKYDWISTGVSLMGDPGYVDFANWQVNTMRENEIVFPLSNQQIEQQLKMLEEYDATLHIEEWIERPLLFWHGKQDKVVPYESAYRFYESLKKPYSKKNVPLSFILDEQAGHAVPNKGVIETIDWFVAHL